MKKKLEVIFLIIGTILGAGFMTGKEISSFFSKFGYYSFLMIPFIFILFYFLFTKFLDMDRNLLKERMKDRTNNFLIFFLNLIFASAMFSAIKNISVGVLGETWGYVLVFVILLISLFVCYGGLGKLISINKVLVPVMLMILFSVMVVGLTKNGIDFIFRINPISMPFFAILYVFFNCSSSAVVVSSYDGKFSKKDIKIISFVSSLILCFFIALGNLVICLNASSLLNSDMPFFQLAEMSGNAMEILMFISIILACLGTLFALLITLKNSIRVKIGSGSLAAFIAVFATFLISFIGFNKIVSLLYPLAGVIGGFLVFNIFIKGRYINKYYEKKKKQPKN